MLGLIYLVYFIFRYENTGASKISVAMNAKTHKKEIIEMLKSADVFITNIRDYQLKGLGLHYDDIKEDAPHLVFVSSMTLSPCPYDPITHLVFVSSMTLSPCTYDPITMPL